MSKIINTKTNETILEDKDYTASGIVTEYFNSKNITYHIFESLSEIIQTMTGDAFTPFNTINEMLEYIPDIVNHGEEVYTLYILDDKLSFIVLGWEHENDFETWSKALQVINTDFAVIEF